MDWAATASTAAAGADGGGGGGNDSAMNWGVDSSNAVPDFLPVPPPLRPRRPAACTQRQLCLEVCAVPAPRLGDHVHKRPVRKLTGQHRVLATVAQDGTTGPLLIAFILSSKPAAGYQRRLIAPEPGITSGTGFPRPARSASSPCRRRRYRRRRAWPGPVLAVKTPPARASAPSRC